MKTISDEQLKAYFLGKLPESEAEMLEIECASSMDSTHRAQLVESELTDDYLRGNLSTSDARLFETNYLTTEARRQKLRVAGSLWKIVNEPAPPIAPVASPSSPTTIWQTLFGARRRFQLAFGGLLLTLAVGAIAFYLLNLSVSKTDVAEVKEKNTSPSSSSPQTENPAPSNTDKESVPGAPPENQDQKPVSTDRTVQNKEIEKASNSPQKNAPEVKTVSPPKNIKPNNPALAMTVKLLPGTLRDEGEQFITIAPNVKNLNLLLNPSGEPNNYKTYRVVVKTAEHETVYTASNLNALSLKIPAEKLENRTYIIFLEGKKGENVFESIAEYVFRVRR